MSQLPTRRDITTQGLLAALGLAVGANALASDPGGLAEKLEAAAPNLVVKATLSHAATGDDAPPSCVGQLEPGAPRLMLKLELENKGEAPVEVLVNDRKVACALRVEAVVPGQPEPWMLAKERTDCHQPMSRAIRREQRPVLPNATLVMGTWELRWPGGLALEGSTLKLTSSISLASGDTPLPDTTLAIPANPKA